MTSFLLSAAFLLAPGPQFEVASIKPAQPMPMNQMRISMNADAGMLRYTNVSLKDCIHVAYRVKDFQIQGPDWLRSARFDIVAKLPDGSSQDQIPEMLAALLEDRFKLKVHRETKEHAIYALVVAKGGPKLKAPEVPAGDKAAQPTNLGKGGPPRGAMMMMVNQAGMHLRASATTLADAAEALSHFTERPVVDMTGIQGRYDFDFVFAPETMRGMPRMAGGKPGDEGPRPTGAAEGARPPAEAPAERAASIFEAVRQYGLKLEPRKGPLETVFVDQIEKTPTEN